MSKRQTINEFLREAREKSGNTQIEAARHLGHSTAQYISNLERGLCQPSVEMAINLCEFYGAKRAEMYNLMLGIYQEQLKKQFKLSAKRR